MPSRLLQVLGTCVVYIHAGIHIYSYNKNTFKFFYVIHTMTFMTMWLVLKLLEGSEGRLLPIEHEVETTWVSLEDIIL